MKCELSTLDGLKKKLDIQLSQDQVAKAMEDGLKNKQKTTALSGFRKGKVPLNQIRSIYGEEIKQNTTINLINEFYIKALQQEKLRPAGEPQIDLKSGISTDKDFQFSATLEIHPEIKVDSDFSVKLKKPKVVVEDKEVDQAIENILNSSAPLVPVLEDRGVQWGDIVELEIKQPEGKESLPIRSKPQLEMTKESNPQQPELKGLKEGILGMKIQAKKSISVEPAGKPVNWEVTVTAMKKKNLPELNDEFVKKFQCKDVAELKKIIRESLQKEKTDKNYEAMRKSVLDQLVKKYPLELMPASLVESQKQAIIASVTNNLKQAGMQEKQIEEYKQKFAEDFEKEARLTVHSSYLIYALAEKLKIQATSQEIQMYLKQQVAQPEQASKEEYRQMENFLIQEKTISHLIDKADSA